MGGGQDATGAGVGGAAPRELNEAQRQLRAQMAAAAAARASAAAATAEAPSAAPAATGPMGEGEEAEVEPMGD